jgi:hypothetical protein
VLGLGFQPLNRRSPEQADSDCKADVERRGLARVERNRLSMDETMKREGFKQ